MNNPSDPDNLVHPLFASDTLRVEYSIKVTGAAGPFMHWQGVFDLPGAFEPTSAELVASHFSEFLKRMVLQGALHRFARLLQERAAMALAAQKPAAQPKPVPRSPTFRPEEDSHWGTAAAEEGPKQPDLESMDRFERAIDERRKADKAHQLEVMAALSNMGKRSRSKTSPPANPTVPAAPSASPPGQASSEPAMRSSTASPSQPPPATATVAPPPKPPRQNSEVEQTAFAPANCAAPPGTWGAPPLQQAA